ncbi:MAG: hypothetical protein NZ992_07960, partial [Candidatus Korarchaeum sp.]|nr:hypothetical protein [Candidatus Korarchaeum sp.]
ALLLLLILLRVSAQVPGGVKLDRNLLSPGEPLRVEISGACNVTLSGSNVTKPLFSGYNDSISLEVDTSGLPLGHYEVINNCSGEVSKASFTLDELSIGVSSPSPNLIEVRVYSKLSGDQVKASIRINGSTYEGPFRTLPGLLMIEANYSGLKALKLVEIPEITVRDYYSPLDSVELIIGSKERPKLKLISPLNASEEVEVERLNSTHWIASLEMQRSIALGSYEALVSVGNLSFSRIFQVTYFYANYSYDGRTLRLSLRDAVTGEPARGTLELRSCFWNRSLEFEGDLITEAGGPLKLSFEDERGLRFETTVAGISSERTLYFPSDEVRLCAAGGSFVIRSPSGRVLLEGSVEKMESISYTLIEGVELGTYSLELGNSSWSFNVDSYSINASFNDGFVEGSISYFIVPPTSVTYTLLPSNVTEEAFVRDGNFSIEVPDDQRAILLECGNARIELERCSSSLELAGVKLEVSNACLTAEERDGGIGVTLSSFQGFSAPLEVMVPKGK